MESFRFSVLAAQLNDTISLDLSADFRSGRIEFDDNVVVEYDAEKDEMTGVVVNQGQRGGHVFDPTSFKADPFFVKEMSDLQEIAD